MCKRREVATSKVDRLIEAMDRLSSNIESMNATSITGGAGRPLSQGKLSYYSYDSPGLPAPSHVR